MGPNQGLELPVSRVHSNEAQNAEANTPAQSPTHSPRILPVQPHPEPANEPLVAANHKTNKEKPTTWNIISDLFIWEILAMALSSAFLVAIIVILTHYDDRPQPTWTLSLNSVISWLSTVSKGCVLFSITEGIGQLKWVWFTRKSRPLVDLSIFDGASRGLYGCAGLVWRLRARHFAALGGVAVILAIAFDPFVQNLIHYYPKLIVDPIGTAVVSSNSVYDALGPPMNVATGYYIDPAMKANIYNSLFNSDSSKPWSTPRYTCSSGNCTWDPIAIMEMRASCTDITDRLATECYNGTNGRRQNTTQQSCSYYLPSGSDIRADVFMGTIWNKPLVIGPVLEGSSARPFIYTKSISTPIQLIAPDNLPTVDTIFAISANENLIPKWQAVECSIDPVVRSIRPKVSRGVYHEETLAISKNGSFPERDSDDYALDPPWGPEMGVEQDTQFMIRKRSLKAIRYFFQSFFAGEAELNPYGFIPSSNTSTYANQDLIQLLTLANITDCTGGMAKKMHCAMDNVAAAMTKAIRDTPSMGNVRTTATGRAMTSMTHVSIHWQWIILPILVWLLGLVTLLGTIWKTRKAKVPTWKNETMPLISLYRNGQDEKPKSDEVSETERVILYQSEGKFSLSG
ncbi:hypothetical protein N7491_000762 [Penicillium cf. griseofulvum]|uniref:Uncharacterized protein n=1 Tax=Penicillium cf. griseofulvum TaxID=2972120 RepID=A0A9W9LYC8_9EURO|nr:hypothetical protein N7472_011167 [Penicillium cf. griseofulvum]KAJ5442922.1 hypothetical protein N7445_004673 [Penicillium cf. griseofulvum]KAJ5451580.1 hypothetical protein N7491_000762 [Penicillium cf. griseofulvum]